MTGVVPVALYYSSSSSSSGTLFFLYRYKENIIYKKNNFIYPGSVSCLKKGVHTTSLAPSLHLHRYLCVFVVPVYRYLSYR